MDFTSPDPRNSIVLAEWLFVHTVDDLAARVNQGDELDRYTTLGLAPLLRKTLLDATPLLNVVQSARRDVGVRFRVSPYQTPPEAERMRGQKLVASFARKSFAPTESSNSITLKQFIHTPVAEIYDETVTVKHLIRHYSHVEGGVHFGKPESQAEKFLLAVTPLLIEAADGWMTTLVEVARSTVAALEPLQHAIRENPSQLASFMRIHLGDGQSRLPTPLLAPSATPNAEKPPTTDS
jgi:hypothetical protein